MGQKPEMTNLNEAAREHMKQETPQELQSVQGHDVPLVAVCRITPPKSNLAIFEMKKPAVRDGYTVSEVREIFNRVLRPCEGLLGVDGPVFIFASSEKSVGDRNALIGRRKLGSRSPRIRCGIARLQPFPVRSQ